jgi:hypothetical protein
MGRSGTSGTSAGPWPARPSADDAVGADRPEMTVVGIDEGGGEAWRSAWSQVHTRTGMDTLQKEVR